MSLAGQKAKEERVYLNENKVEINRLVIENSEVYQFLARREDRVDLVKKAVVIGIEALRILSQAKEAAYVEKKFYEFTRKVKGMLRGEEEKLREIIQENKDSLSKMVEERFDPDRGSSYLGQLKERMRDFEIDIEKGFNPNRKNSYLGNLLEVMREHFDKGGKVEKNLRRIFSLEDEESPLNALRRDIYNLEKEILAAQRLEEVKEKIFPRGENFGMMVEDKIRRLAQVRGDMVERTRGEMGEITACRKGDLVLTLPEGPRITLEVMDRQSSSSVKFLCQELEKAIKNRRAQFGILVARESSVLPREVGVLNRYGNNKLICIYGEKGEILEIAYKWARYYLLIREAKVEGLDLARVKEYLEEIGRIADGLSVIKRQTTNIDKATERIRQMVDEGKVKIKELLEKIGKELEKG